MTPQPRSAALPRMLSHAPGELTGGRLRRLAEGVGKVVYASEHWVVKRERPASEVIALIAVWKLLRNLARILPARLGAPLLRRPSKLIRPLRLLMQAVVLVIPRSVWMMTHIGEVWRVHRTRDIRGARLARAHLTGTSLIPERVTFPPVRVSIGGWPGWLVVSEAIERVEGTLYQRLTDLARGGYFEQFERWLDRFLDLREAGWQLGLFSVDAHLKNYGISGERVVLLDSGGLTDSWTEAEARLASEEGIAEPHVQLGLGPLLDSHPAIAGRFNARWKAAVNRAAVRRHWPGETVKRRYHGREAGV